MVSRRKVIILMVLACGVLAALAALSGWKMPESRSYASSCREASVVENVPLPDGSVDINRGDKEELMRLPGIGPVLAQAIIDLREQGTIFYYPEDLLAVRGIGEKMLADFRDMLKLTEGE